LDLEALEHLFFDVFDVRELAPTSQVSPISSKPANGDRFKTSHLFELLNGLGLVGKPAP
jgi:hypothetical protein